MFSARTPKLASLRSAIVIIPLFFKCFNLALPNPVIFKVDSIVFSVISSSSSSPSGFSPSSNINSGGWNFTQSIE